MGRWSGIVNSTLRCVVVQSGRSEITTSMIVEAEERDRFIGAIMEYDFGYDYLEFDEYENDVWFDGPCDLPGCVMPGPHFSSECHTPEMLDDYFGSRATRSIGG